MRLVHEPTGRKPVLPKEPVSVFHVDAMFLASLFVQMLTAWHHRLGKSLTKARNYDEFCARYMHELTYDPRFCPCWC